MIEIGSEQYERDNVTVVLEWPNEGGGVAYSATVTPESPLMAETLTRNGTQGIKLVLLYNRRYNVSTVATLCGVNSTTSITELNYGEDFITIVSLIMEDRPISPRQKLADHPHLDKWIARQMIATMSL